MATPVNGQPLSFEKAITTELLYDKNKPLEEAREFLLVDGQLAIVPVKDGFKYFDHLLMNKTEQCELVLKTAQAVADAVQNLSRERKITNKNYQTVVENLNHSQKRAERLLRMYNPSSKGFFATIRNLFKSDKNVIYYQDKNYDSSTDDIQFQAIRMKVKDCYKRAVENLRAPSAVANLQDLANAGKKVIAGFGFTAIGRLIANLNKTKAAMEKEFEKNPENTTLQNTIVAIEVLLGAYEKSSAKKFKMVFKHFIKDLKKIYNSDQKTLAEIDKFNKLLNDTTIDHSKKLEDAKILLKGLINSTKNKEGKRYATLLLTALTLYPEDKISKLDNLDSVQNEDSLLKYLNRKEKVGLLGHLTNLTGNLLLSDGYYYSLPRLGLFALYNENLMGSAIDVATTSLSAIPGMGDIAPYLVKAAMYTVVASPTLPFRLAGAVTGATKNAFKYLTK